jgi:rare lipoprotein A
MRLKVRHIALMGAAILTLNTSGSARIFGLFGHKHKTAPTAQPPQDSAQVSAPADAALDVAPPSSPPVDLATYDEVGYASYYGSELAGRQTANGEVYNPDGISAAHKTLPMPSYVEVTNLDTGRTILLRINDRGPFVAGRLIDLSEGAMLLLGGGDKGRVPVRVRRVNPTEQEKTALRMGQHAGDRIDTPEMLLTPLRRKLNGTLGTSGATPIDVPDAPVVKPVKAPKPVKPVKPATAGTSFEPPVAKPVMPPKPKPAPNPAPPVPTASNGTWFIQLGAYSNAASARAVAGKAGAQVQQAGSIYRVRKGPYASEAAARAALGGGAAKGYPGARVTH